jgi:hypothetical protein
VQAALDMRQRVLADLGDARRDDDVGAALRQAQDVSLPIRSAVTAATPSRTATSANSSHRKRKATR